MPVGRAATSTIYQGTSTSMLGSGVDASVILTSLRHRSLNNFTIRSAKSPAALDRLRLHRASFQETGDQWLIAAMHEGLVTAQTATCRHRLSPSTPCTWRDAVQKAYAAGIAGSKRTWPPTPKFKPVHHLGIPDPPDQQAQQEKERRELPARQPAGISQEKRCRRKHRETNCGLPQAWHIDHPWNRQPG